jgi:peptidoglycan-associated lipoprotein
MTPWIKRSLLIGSLAVLCACASSISLDDENDKKGAPIENRGATAGGAAKPPGADGVGRAPIGPTVSVDTTKDALNDPSGPLSKRSIYFDYDSFVVREEFRALIDAHAKYLNTNKTRKIIIQGNTDERGGREYNLALGQKRSEAVRKSFATLGVSDAQLEAVSFGEEKPKATGSDEASQAENRRADIFYP